MPATTPEAAAEKAGESPVAAQLGKETAGTHQEKLGPKSTGQGVSTLPRGDKLPQLLSNAAELVDFADATLHLS